MSEQEIWKPIEGFESKYTISNYGRVKSLARITIRKDGKALPIKERILKVHPNIAGYPQVVLSDRKQHLVHRMVAHAFLERQDHQIQVNHKNLDKTNSHVSNLEWCTASENIAHSIAHGNKVHGSHNGNSKLTEKDIPEIFKLRIKGLSYEEIGNRYNVDQSLISKILIRKMWSHVKVILSLVFLLSLNFTSYGQTGDSLTGYTEEELQRIAERIVRAKECDNLLDIAEKQITVLDSIVCTKDSIIIYRNTVIAANDSIVSTHNEILVFKDAEMESLKNLLDKANRKLKTTKFAWVGTTATLIILWILSAL